MCQKPLIKTNMYPAGKVNLCAVNIEGVCAFYDKFTIIGLPRGCDSVQEWVFLAIFPVKREVSMIKRL